MYFYCEVCGNYQDDGAFVEIDNKYRHICLDCADNMSREQLEQYFLGEVGGSGGRASRNKTLILPRSSEACEVVKMDMRKRYCRFSSAILLFFGIAVRTTEPSLSMVAERSEHKELTNAECNGILEVLRRGYPSCFRNSPISEKTKEGKKCFKAL